MSRLVGQRTVQFVRCCRSILRPCSTSLKRTDYFCSSYGVTNSSLVLDSKKTPFTTWKNLSSSTGRDEDEQDSNIIDTPELVQIVEKGHAGGGNSLIIDVREPEELLEAGEIPGAINISLAIVFDFSSRVQLLVGKVEEALTEEEDIFHEKFGIQKPAQDADIIFFCTAGMRSLVAMEIANRLGYSKSRHYKKGYIGWEEYLDAN